MQHYRYPGTRPFTFEDKNLFFGRDEDVQNLSQLIIIENLVVLYGKSGLGKTSLLNAGVLPCIKEKNNYKTIIVRFGSYSPESFINPIQNFNRLITNGLRKSNFIYDKLIKPEEITGKPLWYSFKENQLNHPDIDAFIIVFDQFEELFTYPDDHITQFKKEFTELINTSIPQQLRNILKEKLLTDKNYLSKEEAHLLYQSINYKVIFSIRSDKLSLMDRLSDYLPNILKKCYELQPLNIQHAINAIVKPAQLTDLNYYTKLFAYSDDALNKITRFLTKDGQQQIETFLLQMVCHHIEVLVQKNNLTTITAFDLGDLQNVSKNFYDNVIAELDPKDQLITRVFIEDGLIFEEDQRRLSLYEGQIFKEYNISKEVLQKLLDSHLLRSEPFHSGGFTYELSHDTLIAPILESKRKRIAEDEKIKLEAKRLEKEKEIAALKVKAEEEKRKRRKANVLSGVAMILLLVASVSFFWAKKKQRETEMQVTNLEKLHDFMTENNSLFSKQDSMNVSGLVDWLNYMMYYKNSVLFSGETEKYKYWLGTSLCQLYTDLRDTIWAQYWCNKWCDEYSDSALVFYLRANFYYSSRKWERALNDVNTYLTKEWTDTGQYIAISGLKAIAESNLQKPDYDNSVKWSKITIEKLKTFPPDNFGWYDYIFEDSISKTIGLHYLNYTTDEYITTMAIFSNLNHIYDRTAPFAQDFGIDTIQKIPIIVELLLINYIESHVEAVPNDYIAYLLKGYLWEQSNHLGPAEEAYKEFLKKEKDDPDHRYSIYAEKFNSQLYDEVRKKHE